MNRAVNGIETKVRIETDSLCLTEAELFKTIVLFNILVNFIIAMHAHPCSPSGDSARLYPHKNTKRVEPEAEQNRTERLV